MVWFHSTATFLATAFCAVHLAQGAISSIPVRNRPSPEKAHPETSGPTIKVLTGTIPNACTPKQVTVLKTSLNEAATLGEAASKALNVKGVETSDSFKSFLGDADPQQMDAQHYAPVAKLRSVTLESVTSDEGHRPGVKATAPATETLFKCLPISHEACGIKGDAARRSTGLVAYAYASERTISFCPIFFETVTVHNPWTNQDFLSKSISLEAGTKTYLAGEDEKDIMGTLVLFHEVQHLTSVVGKGKISDLYVKVDARNVVVPKPRPGYGQSAAVVGVYTIQDCLGIPANRKRENAQNHALFALDVHADPKRAQPKPSGGKRTLDRFDAIYQRAAEKNAAANPTPKNSTSKPGGATADKGTGKSPNDAISAYKRPKVGFLFAPPISDVEG